jgi:hypothetical protein
MRFPILFSFFLGACNPWPQSQVIEINEALWDPEVITMDDGVYAILPRAGRLVRVGTGDTWHTVSLDGARPISIRPDANHKRLMAHVQWPICEDPAPNIILVEECPEEALYWEAEMAIIDEGQRIAVSSVPAHMNGMAFAPDGETAILYMDNTAESHVVSGPIVDLTEVMFLDMESGEVQALSVGFMPRKVLFTSDGARAVVMSRSHVTVLDVATRTVELEYPLTLDADIEIDPSAAVLSPDDRYVMIAIEGHADLYKLDLEVVSIDMEALDGVPSDLANDPKTDKTVITYHNRSQVDVIVEHDFIARESFTLDEPATDILIGDGIALLFNTAELYTHDIIKLDLEQMKTTEYVTENPVHELKVSPNGEFAVATLRPQTDADYGGFEGYQASRWGLAVVNLNTDDVVSLVLESKPVGVELVERDEEAFALVLMEGVEEIIQVELASPGNYSALDLPSPPATIQSSPTGGFTIAHRSPLGQISFLDPTDGTLETSNGFAISGFFSEDRLPRRLTE